MSLEHPALEYEPGYSPAAFLPFGTKALSLAEPDLCLFRCIYTVFLLSGVLRNPAEPVPTQRPDPASAWLMLNWRR